jgi:Pyocin activator protein PrtN
MNTVFLLVAQFGPRVAIPIEDVRREYFPHLELDKLAEKIARGDIRLPIIRAEMSRRAARFVHLTDLAVYLDMQHEAAVKECRQLNGLR